MLAGIVLVVIMSISLRSVLNLFAVFSVLHACSSDKTSPTNGGANESTAGTAAFGAGGQAPTAGAGGAADADSGLSDQTGTRIPGTEQYDCSAAAGDVPALALTKVASSLRGPGLVTYAPGDGRLFIVEVQGTIYVYDNGTLIPQPFLDINERVVSAEDAYVHKDRGLLGMAFHPNFANNGLFYVHYNPDGQTTPYATGSTVISEYHVSASDPNLADPNSERLLLNIPQPGTDHKGGTITFGSDGMLYIALGDGDGRLGTAVDPEQNAQNFSGLLGSILRIDPAASLDTAYTIPADNWYSARSDAAPELWDKGLRNPFRMNFDGCTGILYIGDVGLDNREEVDVELPGQGWHNYGWPITEGTRCVVAGCDQTGFVPPAYEYQHGLVASSLTGGAVYRGSSIPSLRGSYFFADFETNKIWYSKLNLTDMTLATPVDKTSELNAAQRQLGITSIQNAADGELYLTAYIEGAVYRITAL